MTIGLAIKCQNGIVLASDSLASAGNTSKYAQKIHLISHECLLAPVIIVGAGSSAFIDKFIDRCQRGRIEYYCQVLRSALKNEKYMLDIVDFSEGVAESIVCDLYDHYVNNRSNIFGSNVWSSYELQLLVAGATKDCEFRAFTVYHNGISENIETYGTIGSGAQYAEIFLRGLIPSQKHLLEASEASNLALHVVEAAAIMDPNVGGIANIKLMNWKKAGENKVSLNIEDIPNSELQDRQARDEMNQILREIGERMCQVVGVKPEKTLSENQQLDTLETDGNGLKRAITGDSENLNDADSDAKKGAAAPSN